MAPDNKGKTGAVYVIYGAPNLPGSTIDLADPDSSGLRVTTIYGEHHLDCAGDSVRTYDINKDGLSDLFIGSPERTFDIGSEEREDAGVTEIIYGQRDFLPAVIKLYDPPASPRIFRLAGAHGDLQGIAGGDEFSYRLTGGDVDGDGYIDYIANAMHGDGFNNSLTNAGNVYIFSGKKLSAKLGMLPPDQTPTPALTTANLLLNGQIVQQASAGQSGLVIRVNGTGFRADTEIQINGLPVISHAGADPQQRLVNLDENTTIRNSAGALTVRARNTIPTPSEFSNQVNAGSLVGPEITSIKVKKKASGLLILKIHGLNFPADATVTITADGSAVPVQSASFDPPDYASVKISEIGAKHAIFIGLVVYAAISVVGYYMKTATDFLILAILVGMGQGGTQALSRSLFASLIPRQGSAEFFGFFAVVEKFAGIFGLAVFAQVIAATGSSRSAILSIVAFFVVGGVLLAKVDVVSGQRAARAAEAPAI